ncbi:MAG: S8 family serine peptidase [Deltaproteobacteria bacterium]|nr:S8 family serine peptidase [Deltaproteobacteria bacterium]
MDKETLTYSEPTTPNIILFPDLGLGSFIAPQPKVGRSMKLASIIIILSLLGCSTGVNDTPSRPASDRPPCQALGSDPFFCVKEKCQANGGQFDGLTCQCPEGKVFSGWEKGACVAKASLSSCVKEGFVHALEHNPDSFAECLVLARTAKTSLWLRSVKDNQTDRNLAEWADKYLVPVQAIIGDIPALYQSASIEWLVGPGKLDILGEKNLAELASPQSIFLHYPREDFRVSSTLYFFENDNLADIFKPGKLDGKVTLPEPPQTQHREIVTRARLAVNEMLSRPFSFNRWVPYSDDGCAGHCELFADLQSSVGPVTRVREFVAGQLFTDTVFVWADPDKQRAYAKISLLPSGQVSLIHLFIQTSDPSQSAILLQYLYDRKWQPLLKAPRNRVVLTHPKELWRLTESFSRPPQASPQAIVCESGFEPSVIEALNPASLLLGPLAPSGASPNQSLFGWLSVPTQNGKLNPRFLSGTVGLTETGVRLPMVPFADHALKVARNILGADGDVKIIPIGSEDCSDYGGLWLPQIKSHSTAKILNWSSTGHYSKQACAHSPFGEQIRNNPSILYVVAAGNDGLNGDATAIHYCPQALTGTTNLVVVASGGPWAIHHNSNYGVNYADIVADGSHAGTGPQTQATSFATPQVARVAAQLAFKYPSLSVQQIRNAILFSVDIHGGWHGLSPLPVRSGGVLNPDNAAKFASFYAKQGGDEEAIKSIYCFSYRERIKLFKERGLLP